MARGDKRPIRPGARPPSHANVRRAVTHPPHTVDRIHSCVASPVRRGRGCRVEGRRERGATGGPEEGVVRSGGASRTSGVWHGSASTGRVCVSSLPRSSSGRFGTGAVRGLGQRGEECICVATMVRRGVAGTSLGVACGCGEAALDFGLQWWACLVGGRRWMRGRAWLAWLDPPSWIALGSLGRKGKTALCCVHASVVGPGFLLSSLLSIHPI